MSIVNTLCCTVKNLPRVDIIVSALTRIIIKINNNNINNNRSRGNE